MTITVFGAAFDAHDAARVARFWAATLGRDLAEGATTLHTVDNDARWTTMADPEDNEFDVIAG